MPATYQQLSESVADICRYIAHSPRTVADTPRAVRKCCRHLQRYRQHFQNCRRHLATVIHITAALLDSSEYADDTSGLVRMSWQQFRKYRRQLRMCLRHLSTTGDTFEVFSNRWSPDVDRSDRHFCAQVSFSVRVRIRTRPRLLMKIPRRLAILLGMSPTPSRAPQTRPGCHRRFPRVREVSASVGGILVRCGRQL